MRRRRPSTVRVHVDRHDEVGLDMPDDVGLDRHDDIDLGRRDAVGLGRRDAVGLDRAVDPGARSGHALTAGRVYVSPGLRRDNPGRV
jgi:hypothetical protein